MSLSSFIVHTWVHLVHMGTHGKTWATCILEKKLPQIKLKIFITFNLFNINFKYVSYHIIFIFLFIFCNKILLDSYFTCVTFLFLFVLFHNLDLELGLVLDLVQKSCSIGYFHVCDNFNLRYCCHSLPLCCFITCFFALNLVVY